MSSPLLVLACARVVAEVAVTDHEPARRTEATDTNKYTCAHAQRVSDENGRSRRLQDGLNRQHEALWAEHAFLVAGACCARAALVAVTDAEPATRDACLAARASCLRLMPSC